MSIDFAAIGGTMRVIIDLLLKAFDFTMPRSDLIAKSGKTENSIRSALYRMKLKGLVENIDRGMWKLQIRAMKVYRNVRHTIRIIETVQAQRRHEWDCDAEATSEGLVPYPSGEEFLPPERPPKAYTESVASILTPLLKREMLDVLGRQGVILRDAPTMVEATCDRVLILRAPRFCITGTEWLDEMSYDFDPTHEVEVAFRNNVGTLYNFYGTMTVEEDQF